MSKDGQQYGVTTPASDGTTFETAAGHCTMPARTGKSPWPRSIVDSQGNEVARVDRASRNKRTFTVAGQDYALSFGAFGGRWKIDGMLGAHRTLGARFTTGTNAKPFVGSITADLVSQPNAGLLLLAACHTIMSRIDAMGATERSGDNYRQALG